MSAMAFTSSILQKTLKMFRDAARFVSERAGQGKSVLFLGTKRQAQEAIKEEAERCGMFYVNHRWLGGTLTNWVTLQKSIKRLKLLKAMIEDGRMSALPEERSGAPRTRVEASPAEFRRRRKHGDVAGCHVRDRSEF